MKHREIKLIKMKDPLLIKDYKVPHFITVLSAGVFSQCRNLSNVKLPINLKRIASGSFSNTKIKEIHLPRGVDLGLYVFENCIELEKIKLPSDLEVVSEGLFSGCINLTNIELPRSITKVEKFAFFNSGIKEVKVFRFTKVRYLGQTHIKFRLTK